MTVTIKAGKAWINGYVYILDADGYELGIADILIGNGVTSIVQANITDLRQNNTYCGIDNSLITADTTTLFN